MRHELVPASDYSLMGMESQAESRGSQRRNPCRRIAHGNDPIGRRFQLRESLGARFGLLEPDRGKCRQRSVAITGSNPIRLAASPNTRVWYPVVAARIRTRFD
jgi:hypothetical protein